MILYGAEGLTERKQAYDLLKRAVWLHWGMSALPPIRRTSQGKPFFEGMEDRCFNLSHSGSLALCVLDQDPVGVDIQIMKQWREGLPRRVCSNEEYAWLRREGDLWARFTLLWALKESRVKQSGVGLRQPIAGIRAPLPDGDGPLPFDGLWFRCCGGDGWRGAVCGRTPPPREICWVTL